MKVAREKKLVTIQKGSSIRLSAGEDSGVKDPQLIITQKTQRLTEQTLHRSMQERGHIEDSRKGRDTLWN